MIELCFSDSTAGSLRIAKSRRKGEMIRYVSGAVVAVSSDEREGLPEPCPMEQKTGSYVWEGEELGGTSQDVVSLGLLALDMGDLSDVEGDMAARRTLLEALLTPWAGKEGAAKEWVKLQTSLDRVKAAGETGEPVRIWLCDGAPFELCGLGYVCHLLRGTKVELSTVFLPRREVREDSVVEYCGSGEFHPEELCRLATLTRPLTAIERTAYGSQWQELVRENAPLRAVVNGKLMGVGADFYDFALRANIPAGEFKAPVLLGERLCRLSGVGDWWLHQRLLAMVAAGELEEVCPPEEPGSYRGQVLRKVN